MWKRLKLLTLIMLTALLAFVPWSRTGDAELRFQSGFVSTTENGRDDPDEDVVMGFSYSPSDSGVYIAASPRFADALRSCGQLQESQRSELTDRLVPPLLADGPAPSAGSTFSIRVPGRPGMIARCGLATRLPECSSAC